MMAAIARKKENFLARTLRASARMLWETANRTGQYDGASSRRRLATYQPGEDSASALIAADGRLLRRRSRDLLRNNPYAQSACQSFTSNLIGAGIKPSSLVTQRKEINKLWEDWCEEADADGLTDFYGLQAMVSDALFEAGECFIRLRQRLPEDGLAVPLQIQVLESEMVPYERNQTEANGNRTINGIEFDKRGKRVAYYFFRQHPGDAKIFGLNTAMPVRVSADYVLHIFYARRPGQVRGVPMTAGAITRLWLLDQYDDAELDRKKVAAMFAGFIKSPEAERVISDIETDPYHDDTGLATLEPGTLQTLLPGEEITFSNPTEVGGSYEVFEYRNILSACAAMGVPYAAVTGDLKGANYSSMRAGLVEFRRRLEQRQFGVMVHQMCKPVRRAFMDAAVISGVLSLPNYFTAPREALRARWIAPKFEWVDPYKDAQAEKIAVDNLFKSRSDVIEAQGEDPEETDARILADQEREQKLGLVRRDAKSATPAPDGSEDADADADNDTQTSANAA